MTRRRTIAASAAAVAVLAAGITVGQLRPTPAVCNIDPGNGEQAITAAINSCPDGSTVTFPPGHAYTQANRIEVKDRNDLTIDGNGSTFTITSTGADTQAVNGNWIIVRGSNITLRNMTAVGSFDLPGPRSLAAESADPGYTEAMPGFGIYGTDGVVLEDVKAFNVWGDGVTTGPSAYVHPDGVGVNDYANEVTVTRMEVRKTSRHCWAFTSGVGVTLQDSSCTDAWYAALDSETDSTDQPLRNHRYLRNTFDGFNLGGLLIPVPGEKGKTGDIEIVGNRFLTTPDVECNSTLLVGGYPNIGADYGFDNVKVDSNEFATYARAITLDHVNGGSVRGNRIRQLIPSTGATVLQHCGEDRQIIVTSSTGVVVGDPVPLPTTTTTTAPATTTTTVPVTVPPTTSPRPPASPRCSGEFITPAGEHLVVCKP